MGVMMSIVIACYLVGILGEQFWLLSRALESLEVEGKSRSSNPTNDQSDTIACEPTIVSTAKTIDNLWRRSCVESGHGERMEYRERMLDETLSLVRSILGYRLRGQQPASLGEEQVVVLAQRRDKLDD